MNARDIRIFFKELDRRLPIPIQVILTGGVAAILRGVRRSTDDIDFELRLMPSHAKDPHQWDRVRDALAQTRDLTHLEIQFDSDIGRWGVIPLPKRKGERYAKIGKVDVRLLEAGVWAIGKLSRYLESDVNDLRVGLKTAKTRAEAMARLWGAALGMSPPATMNSLFSRQAQLFFDQHAREIWGPKTDPVALKRIFLNAARRTKESYRRWNTNRAPLGTAIKRH